MSRRAVIYVRISRDRVGAGLGVDRQREDCQALADREGLHVVAVHSDNDLSAYSGKPRPEYLAMLAGLRAGTADVVIAWHTDRLHRSPVELEDYIAICEPRGIPTLTVKAGPLDLSTPAGRMVARQHAAVARYEVDHMRERQQRAKLQAASEGRWRGGRRPYGYEADGVTVRASEARDVLWASDGVVAGRTLRGMAAELHLLGSRTSTGAAWTSLSLRDVLLRARNAGLIEMRGEILGAAQWPAIVPEATWRAVVAILTDPLRSTTTSNVRYRGSGLYRCGVCDGLLSSYRPGNTRRRQPRTYACRAGKHVVRQADALDAWVDAVVVARLRDPAVRDLLAGDDTDPAAGLSTQLSAVRSRLDDLAAAFAVGDIDARQMGVASRRLRDDEARLLDELASCTSPAALGGLADAIDPAEAWASASVDQQRAAIDVLMTVVVHRGSKGRPSGWRAGESYFSPSSVEIRWR